MATSHPFETPVEGDVDVDVDEAVKQILAEMEAEEQDPLEGMGNVQIAEIYHKMKPEDQRLFRQFKRFHKRYYETHGHDAPSHQLTRGIVQQMFPGLPSADAGPSPRRGPNCWLLKESRSCASSWDWRSQLSCQAYPQPPEAPEYPPPPQPPRFLSRQEKERAAQQQASEEAEIKPDIKPRRLATTYLGPLGLLRMVGTGDEEHIITRSYQARIHCRTLRKTIPHSLSSLMMTPMSPVMRTTSQRSPWFWRAASASKSFRHFCLMLQCSTSEWQLHWTPLASRVEDMSVEQVEEVAMRVVSESGHVRGLTEITNVFDKGEVALILACGVRRYQEYQALKGKREDKDIISYRQLQKKFGTNKRTLMEVGQGYKFIPVPRRHIYEGAIYDNKDRGGRRGPNHERDSCDK